jgi:ATP-binding cassette subfamily C protein
VERDTRKIEKNTRRLILASEANRAIQFPMQAAFAAVGLYLALEFWDVPGAELGVLLVLFSQTVGKLTRAQRQYQLLVSEEQYVWALSSQIEQILANQESSTGTRTPSLERGISLERVQLAYGELRVLDSASLEVPAGEVTAIVGPSGAGKTSLADLVCGLVLPDAGTVRVDGVPLPEIDLRAWRSSIGYVPQEIFLVNGSIRENVTLGEDLSDEEVEGSLRRAGAWSFVSQLPDGMHAPVGERGAQLSGGQRQRICIARALVHRPSLLVLDEATTALDPATEAHILDSIVELRGQLTVLAISHQPQLMSIADRIYRIEAGKVHPVEPDLR